MTQFPSQSTLVLTILLLAGMTSFSGAVFSSTDTTTPATNTESRASEAPAVREARLGLLPDAGGVSLDLIVLALIGAGYGILRLNSMNPVTDDNSEHALTAGVSALSSETALDDYSQAAGSDEMELRRQHAP